MPGAGPDPPPPAALPWGAGLCVCVCARPCTPLLHASCFLVHGDTCVSAVPLLGAPLEAVPGAPRLPSASLVRATLARQEPWPSGQSRLGAAGQRGAGSQGVRPGDWQRAHPCPALGLCGARARVSGSGLGRREPSPCGATSDVGPLLASAGGSGLGAPAPLTPRHRARVRPVSLPAPCPCWPCVPGHVQHRAHAAVLQPWVGLRARGDGCWGLLTSPGSCGGRG